ncbi:hypothetical protein BYT27DRAFT_7200000, partial [Phlegmacium glaucopus]
MAMLAFHMLTINILYIHSTTLSKQQTKYFLHIVPITYIAPRTRTLYAPINSVTHYTREVQYAGSPPNLFQIGTQPSVYHTTPVNNDLPPPSHPSGRRSWGVFVCMSYAICITTRPIGVVSSADQAPGIIAA